MKRITLILLIALGFSILPAGCDCFQCDTSVETYYCIYKFLPGQDYHEYACHSNKAVLYAQSRQPIKLHDGYWLGTNEGGRFRNVRCIYLDIKLTDTAALAALDNLERLDGDYWKSHAISNINPYSELYAAYVGYHFPLSDVTGYCSNCGDYPSVDTNVLNKIIDDGKLSQYLDKYTNLNISL